MKILVLGGYGTFGGRLVELLSADPRLTLVIAGRSESKAQSFIKTLMPGAEKIALAFDRDADRDSDLDSQISAIKPELVVDATGPFQFYGASPYRVVEACLRQKVNYLDLADGAQFVKGIAQFDREAKRNHLFILSGVSSFPVLTAAVVRQLSRGLGTINQIRGGIAPSPYAGVGLNVIRAVAGYAGRKIPLVRDGLQAPGYGLTETMRYTISPPGYLPLQSTLFSLVDVPDLQVLPQLWPELKSIWMGAGPVPEIFHRMLIVLAWLVRWRFLPPLPVFAPLFHFVINNFRWGEHRGGMFVSVQGIDSGGRSVRRSWHLIAEGNDGPYIPSMAVESIVRRSLAGMPPSAGARPCITDLELADYDLLFQNRKIRTGRREETWPAKQTPLYQTILGNAWELLSAPLQAMHSGNLEASGTADVRRGTGMLSRLVALIFGFPEAATGIPVKVKFQSINGGELWQRTFNGKSFSSFQSIGKKRSEGLLSERFGPLSFDMALVVEDEKLRLVVRRWSFLGITLPAYLVPTGDAYEFSQNGKFHFHVEIAHVLTGLIVCYRGWLVPLAND